MAKECKGGAQTGAPTSDNDQLSIDLATVVAAWPKLTVEVHRSIAAIVREALVDSIPAKFLQE
jgi:hypothetical protein